MTSSSREATGMTTVLFEVDVRQRVALLGKLKEQHALRAAHGEQSFRVLIDDNARHIAYVFLEWESISSAHKFLESAISQELIAEWPIEKVISASPFRDLLREIESMEHNRDA